MNIIQILIMDEKTRVETPVVRDDQSHEVAAEVSQDQALLALLEARVVVEVRAQEEAHLALRVEDIVFLIIIQITN